MSLAEEHAKEIPEEIKRAVNAIDNDKRLGILVALLKRGEMTFSQLIEITQLNQSTLNDHLKILMKGTLVTNYYKRRLGTLDYSYYDVTDFGRAFLDGLYRSLEVEPRISVQRIDVVSVTENKSVVLEGVPEEGLLIRVPILPPGITTKSEHLSS